MLIIQRYYTAVSLISNFFLTSFAYVVSSSNVNCSDWAAKLQKEWQGEKCVKK